MDALFSSVRSLGIYIAVGVLGIIAVSVALRTLGSRRQAGASKAWSDTTGTILSATVAAGRTPGRNGVSYYPVVMYQYSVNGQQYMGNRIRFGTQVGFGVQAWAARGLGNYPVGATVPVYYDPTNPADSVLERGASTNWGNLLVVAILLIAIFTLLTSFGILNMFGR